jgi:hypothetical protein
MFALRCNVLIVAALSCALAACMNEPPADVGDETAALTIDPAALSGGSARPLADGITAAENLLYTSTGRLFATGDDGIFEIVQEGSAYHSIARHTGETCHFGGMAEVSGTLYANCYDMDNAVSELFAAKLSDAPEFRSIFRMPGIQLANGLATDGAGSLFIAATFQGQILRLQLSAADPFAIASQEILVPDAGSFADGLKLHGDTLYWTNFTLIESAQLLPRGGIAPPQAVASALTFLDDLYVADSGIFAADALVGSIRSFSPRGLENGSTPAGTFDGPSAVLPAEGKLGLPQDALVVSERNPGRVSVFTP